MATKAERTAEIQERIAARVTPKQRKEIEKQQGLEEQAARREAERREEKKHARMLAYYNKKRDSYNKKREAGGFKTVDEMVQKAVALGIHPVMSDWHPPTPQ